MIAALTEGEKELAWMPATNDANEGALGSFRSFARRKPTAALKLFNSLFRYRKNNTEVFIQENFHGRDNALWLMRKARREDEEGRERKLRLEIAEQRAREAAEREQRIDSRRRKAAANTARLQKIDLVIDRVAIERLSAKQLKDQLQKFKIEFTDAYVPPFSKMTKKEEKKVVLLRLLRTHCSL